MSRRTAELDPEERRLWRRVGKTVKGARAAAAPAVAPIEPKPKHLAPKKKTPPPSEKPASPKAALTPKAPPADRGGERKVKRGQVAIAGRIDLHGHTQESARKALHAFLLAAPPRSVILVITGKGRGGEEGVLRKRLPEWLAAPGVRPRVAGFARAHADHGGAGAFYVFIRAS